MTMVNATMTTPTNRNGVSLRKTNKPLMEKRRRARINDSLSQLKSLVIHSSKKDSSQFSKLEKADILELTVKHLRGLQAQQQQHHQMSTVSQVSNNGPASTDALVNGKYRAGFVECANQVIRYLDQSQGLNNDAKSKVISHLGNCLQVVSTNPAPAPLHPHHQQQLQQQQQHQQQKLAPQPIQQAPATVPQPPPQLAPNNTAAILAAAAAAAAAGNMNPNLNTTTQLPNGQIIQIVSSGNNNDLSTVHLQQQHHHQPIHPHSLPSGLNQQQQQAISSSHTTLIPVLPQQTTKPSSNSINAPPTTNSSSTSIQTSTPSYIHYAQPLHIQIPPIISPVLIKKESNHHQNIQPHHRPHHQTTKPIEQSREPLKNTYPSSNTITPPSLPDHQVNDIAPLSSSSTISSSNNNSSIPHRRASSPQRRLSTSPPSSLYPGHPKARAQKQLNFFNSQSDNNNKFSSPPPRCVKNDYTPPPSSASSSSSSESENTSPLNLSQSPPSFSAYNKVHKRHNFHTQHPYSQKTNEDNHQHQSSIIPSGFSQKSNSLLMENQNRLLKEGNHNIQSSAPQNHPSVVTMESRKCSDFSSGKLYWSMMEEDRHCIRHQNTPSPASSVGEERVWRPW